MRKWLNDMFLSRVVALSMFVFASADANISTAKIDITAFVIQEEIDNGTIHLIITTLLLGNSMNVILGKKCKANEIFFNLTG